MQPEFFNTLLQNGKTNIGTKQFCVDLPFEKCERGSICKDAVCYISKGTDTDHLRDKTPVGGDDIDS